MHCACKFDGALASTGRGKGGQGESCQVMVGEGMLVDEGGGGNVARYAKCAKLTLLLRALTVALPAASVGIVGLLARLAAARMMNGKCENC